MKRAVPVIVGVLCMVLLLSWSQLASALAPESVLEVPERGNVYQPPAAPPPPATVVTGPGEPASIAGSFVAFRSADGDGIYEDATPLNWSGGQPPILWHATAGIGHSGFAVRDGKVYIQDYEEDERQDLVRCLSLADGQEIWRNAYPQDFKPNHGYTRATPTVTADRVIALAPKAVLSCLDARTGERVWAINLVDRYQLKIPAWWSAQSPLIEGDACIVAPCGVPENADRQGVLMTALSLEPGPDGEPEVLWEVRNRRNWNLTHSTIHRCQLDGRTTYVYCADKGVVGVWADTGEKAWDTTLWQVPTATVTHPVDCGENRIFLGGGYSSGSMMIQIEADASGLYQARELWSLPARPNGYGAEQHNAILYQGHLYGCNAGNKGEVVCIDLDDNQLWSAGKAHRFGLGPFLIANDRFLAIDPDGRLEMATLSPAGYELLARAQLDRKALGADADGHLHNAWAPITVVDGRLLMRDQRLIMCLDLRGG
ncbi:MAG: PQQ-binding-like beta-propeller repeat protein [Planctomycetota bacterium]